MQCKDFLFQVHRGDLKVVGVIYDIALLVLKGHASKQH
jgi:hypothetical protein